MFPLKSVRDWLSSNGCVGVTDAFKKDTNEKKINLGVGMLCSSLHPRILGIHRPEADRYASLLFVNISHWITRIIVAPCHQAHM